MLFVGVAIAALGIKARRTDDAVVGEPGSGHGYARLDSKPVESLIYRQGHGNRFRDGRRLSEGDVGRTQRLGGAPISEGIENGQIVSNVDLAVNDHEIVLVVLRRCTGVEAEATPQQEIDRMIEPIRTKRQAWRDDR